MRSELLHSIHAVSDREPARLRVVIVARARDRARWRELALASGLTIAGEVETIAEARAIGAADALLLPARGDNPSAGVPTEALTPRERQVLELLAEGLSNKGVASRLGISDQTVKFHVASIIGKLAAANRTEAVRIALRRGLLTF